ncbi:A/G-specific adenine glycosylase [Mesorhizobium sp. YIM 152430]|uniref:A/G-specific adenine glycosylase n=1 Tax=Mesorhizobium sp. YIM 152430 TaxID=3031761 RepID=UPI0023DABF9D|nr:A/G-specific adenine glycosylase [Mesorhizobium sp. YIM 152430]MDF1601237.1 A/G-specific adenine glycosylase [Mesorhizobium sp. YIM 152430]
MAPSGDGTWFDAERGKRVAAALLAWYDKHHRDLPWRIPPRDLAAGSRTDPYRVWLSEIMLQQTTVEAVKPYFLTFIERWPTVSDLAAADSDDIMKAWAGLGYYSRARNLKTCAEVIENVHDGAFPNTETGLLALPGIGPYTAAAIAAIAFDRPAAVVDGNVERVFTRLAAIATPLPKAKSEIKDLVALAVPLNRPGDFAQATMDLGATICTPRRPKCLMCPVRDECLALRQGDPEHYPVKAAKAEKPLRRGAAFVAIHDGAIFLRKREAKGLLGGMAEVPSTGWTSRTDGELVPGAAPFAAKWENSGSISHVFTHFALELTVFRAEIERKPVENGGWWTPLEDIHTQALPTVMKKAIEAAIPGSTKARAKEKSR